MIKSLLAFLTNPELIVGAHRLAALEINFDDFLALQLGAGFVVERIDDLSGLAVDDVTAGGDHILAANGHKHPTRKIAQFDVSDLFGWHDGIVEDVDII